MELENSSPTKPKKTGNYTHTHSLTSVSSSTLFSNPFKLLGLFCTEMRDNCMEISEIERKIQKCETKTIKKSEWKMRLNEKIKAMTIQQPNCMFNSCRY